jgi:hypothetical protein
MAFEMLRMLVETRRAELLAEADNDRRASALRAPAAPSSTPSSAPN